ncbi:uncharacterized protein LOC106175745 [Lingula anatina]|uniref:Uncharacterized protein LOC106175745 n=1 Tax=Lingula anatina TaxID=7574 RepID=A0A1S3JSK2_LINAN|nr:uncharacterized protein LOC106175745 [Lingula anatina]|eukprot:XP_013413328.1 uncharacterized protein LOC106175745 [Lingula anatina]
MEFLLRLLSFLCVYTFSKGIEASQTSYVCFKEGDSVPQQTDIHCPEGQRIRVLDAIYGVNPWDACYFLEGDCTVQTTDADHCCNQNSCTVTGRQSYLTSCGGQKSFLRIVYECVREHVTCPGDSPSSHPDVLTRTLSINIPVSTTTAPPPSSPAIDTSTVKRYWKTWNGNEAQSKATNTPDDILLWACVGAGIVAVLLAIAVVVVCIRKRQLQDTKSNLLKPNGSPVSSNGSSPERPELQTRYGPDGDSQAFENFVCNKDSGLDVSNDVAVTISDSPLDNVGEDVTQAVSHSRDARDTSLERRNRGAAEEYRDTVCYTESETTTNGVSVEDTSTELLQNYDNQNKNHSYSVQDPHSDQDNSSS